MESTTIEIELNGRKREIADGRTVADLVVELALRPGMVAVEVNERVVPRSDRATTLLKSGDKVELVTIMGGG